LQFYPWKQEENTRTQLMHVRTVVGFSNVFNSQHFLLLLLISEQLRYKLGATVPLGEEFAGTLHTSGLMLSHL
jgi:hypothetical protein